MLLTQILSSHEKPIITAFLTPASSRLWFVMARVKVLQQQINIDNHVQREVSGAMHEFVAFKIYCQLNVMMQQFLKSCLVIIQNYFIFITVSHWLGWWLVSVGSVLWEKSLWCHFPISHCVSSPQPGPGICSQLEVGRCWQHLWPLQWGENNLNPPTHRFVAWIEMIFRVLTLTLICICVCLHEVVNDSLLSLR